MLKRILFVNLFSDKNEDLVRFYRDTLGLEAMSNQREADSWYGFKTEGTTFAIEPESNRERYKNLGVNLNNKILIQFEAESIEELEEINQQLESKGVKLINRCKESSYGIFTNFLDPDSNLVEILCHKKSFRS